MYHICCRNLQFWRRHEFSRISLQTFNQWGSRIFCRHSTNELKEFFQTFNPWATRIFCRHSTNELEDFCRHLTNHEPRIVAAIFPILTILPLVTMTETFFAWKWRSSPSFSTAVSSPGRWRTKSVFSGVAMVIGGGTWIKNKKIGR